jgi:hypothetical protein
MLFFVIMLALSCVASLQMRFIGESTLGFSNFDPSGPDSGTITITYTLNRSANVLSRYQELNPNTPWTNTLALPKFSGDDLTPDASWVAGPDPDTATFSAQYNIAALNIATATISVNFRLPYRGAVQVRLTDSHDGDLVWSDWYGLFHPMSMFVPNGPQPNLVYREADETFLVTFDLVEFTGASCFTFLARDGTVEYVNTESNFHEFVGNTLYMEIPGANPTFHVCPLYQIDPLTLSVTFIVKLIPTGGGVRPSLLIFTPLNTGHVQPALDHLYLAALYPAVEPIHTDPVYQAPALDLVEIMPYTTTDDPTVLEKKLLSMDVKTWPTSARIQHVRH